MARPARGTIITTALADGTEKYRLRFQDNGERRDMILHERRECACGCGGGWSERMARAELDTIIAKVRAGVWRAPLPQTAPLPPTAMPTFHEYASGWLERKRNGTIGDRTISANTYQGYRGALTNHLLPYFARYRLDEIDRHLWPRLQGPRRPRGDGAP